MQNLNRRITEAYEKTARAKTRIAASKEALVRNFDKFMEICDGDEADVSKQPPKIVPPKKQPPR